MENSTDFNGTQPQSGSYPFQVVTQNPGQVELRQEQVTTLEQLVSFAKGAIVQLPDFAEGMPFVARMRRPSLLALAKFGKIPNNLLVTAGQLFSGDTAAADADNTDMLADMYNVCEIIAEASLIEPTFGQVREAGLELTDEQLLAIFNYTQSGVSALESFR